MQIYFEDGELRADFTLSPRPDLRIDAAAGFSANEKALDAALKDETVKIVYTNSLVALSNKYCWNDDKTIPELYIRRPGCHTFDRIDKCTAREIRYAHNVMLLYMNGEFR